MRQLVYTMFINNNRPSFHLWWKKNSVKHRKIWSQNILKLIVATVGSNNVFASNWWITPANICHDERVLIKTNIFVVIIRLQNVFKTFSRRLRDALLKLLEDVFKTSWSRGIYSSYSFVFRRHLQSIFKTSRSRLIYSS